MIADIQHGTIWDAVVSLWVPATIGAIAAVYAAKVARDNRRRLDTSNGSTIGTTIHDMAQTVEVLMAQVHTNTTEVLEARTKAQEASEQANMAAAEAGRNTRRLEDYITEATHIHAEILRRLPEG